MQYTISGPNDVAVIAKQPAGLGIIHLTLQIPASAAAGARTLFIQNANLDFAPASVVAVDAPTGAVIAGSMGGVEL